MEKRLGITHVVGAVIVDAGLVFCTQRARDSSTLPLLWEFPGGKVEPNETAQEALKREIYEELRCQVVVGSELTTTVHEYEFATIRLTTFRCMLLEGRPQLTEHAAARWLRPAELVSLDWAPADVPAVHLIIDNLPS